MDSRFPASTLGQKEGQASCPKPVHPPAWGPSCRDLHAARPRPRTGLVEAGKDRWEDQRKAAEVVALNSERWDENSTRGEWKHGKRREKEVRQPREEIQKRRENTENPKGE